MFAIFKRFWGEVGQPTDEEPTDEEVLQWLADTEAILSKSCSRARDRLAQTRTSRFSKRFQNILPV